ncbi:MAG: RlmE family RNA methyltransferase [Candidatus Geothermarchaeales archaeon]
MPRKTVSWVKERRKEHYHQMAKRRGYRSRAYYKLKQIDSRFNILRKNMRVVDLGAAPGGWTQYAAEAVGEGGLIVGVDLRKMEPLPYENVKTLRLDVTEEEAPKKILEATRGRVDVLLSDLSPSVSGVWTVDVARQVALCEEALRISDGILRRGGSMIMKVFEGKDTPRIIEWLKREFSVVRLFKPPASRKRSSEVYALCFGFKG